MDKIPVKEVPAWEKAFLAFMRDQKPEIRKKIVDTKDLDDDTMTALNAAIEEFQKQFRRHGGTNAIDRSRESIAVYAQAQTA